VTADVLQVRFDSPQALRSEFEKNIANRGVFVASEAPVEVRQPIVVEIVLDYGQRNGQRNGEQKDDPNEAALTLEGEVVHVIPPEMAASGATPGIAVQFDASATDLRDRFEPLLGAEVAKRADPAVDPSEGGRRSARRGAVRVPVRVMPTSRPSFEATSRDLSRSGILLSMREDALPIGERVRVHLWHPSGEPTVEIDGEVVRQVPNKQGEVAAVAVAFDRTQAADDLSIEVIEALREAGHQNRLGGISGSLADLGLANMLQMFGTSAPEGTLVIEREGEQGWVAFADGQLIGAELGALEGREALIAMLGWGEGRFQFEATADRRLAEKNTPEPLIAVVLDAVCAIDERERDASAANASDESGSDSIDVDVDVDVESFEDLNLDDEEEDVASVVTISEASTFDVDPEQEDLARSSLDKTDEAILDLAKAGMSVERMFGVIPEPAEVVRVALEGLVELGVLVPR